MSCTTQAAIRRRRQAKLNRQYSRKSGGGQVKKFTKAEKKK